MNTVTEYAYHVCYNTEMQDYEGRQYMSIEEAKDRNARNKVTGDPQRWIIDNEHNEIHCVN